MNRESIGRCVGNSSDKPTGMVHAKKYAGCTELPHFKMNENVYGHCAENVKSHCYNMPYDECVYENPMLLEDEGKYYCCDAATFPDKGTRISSCIPDNCNTDKDCQHYTYGRECKNGKCVQVYCNTDKDCAIIPDSHCRNDASHKRPYLCSIPDEAGIY